jgi:hypothetical protein
MEWIATTRLTLVAEDWFAQILPAKVAGGMTSG